MGQPREIDISMMNCPQELLESVEDLQYTVEELQSCYGNCKKQNEELKQELIKKEKEFNSKIQVLNEELSALRHTKVRIARENIMKECPVTPRWFTALTKSVEQEKKIADLISKVDELKLVIMERDGTISSLKHQLKDTQATIVVLTSYRNRMAIEMEELALRLEEMEHDKNFRNAGTVRRNSSKDEDVKLNDQHSTVHRSTSHGNEDGSVDFNYLKRAENLSNINSLDESVDFKLEKESNILSRTIAPNGRDETDSVTSCEANEHSLLTREKKDSNGSPSCRAIKENKTVTLHKDTSWERFDRSDSSVALYSLHGNKKHKFPPIHVGDAAKLNAFKEPDKISPFTQLVESTPVARHGRDNSEAESIPTTLSSDGIENPWMSPGQSPITERKPRNTPRNLFWERNDNGSACPFYIPDSTSEKDVQEDGLGFSSGMQDKFPPKVDREFDERLNDNFDAISPKSIQSNFSFDEKTTSFDEDSRKPPNVVIKKASRENLWDFEPDSIVDVSTGQTIYESLKNDEDSQTSENGSYVENESYGPRQEVNDLDCSEKSLPIDDHARSVSDITNDMSKEKAKSLAKILDKRSNSHVSRNSQKKDREFVRKGKRKEREALKTYMEWKTQGKHGTPPANYKISMC